MYKVFNGTSKYLFIDAHSSLLGPNETKTISNSIFDIESFQDRDLGVCEITSAEGKHSCCCHGNISCHPLIGSDGTTFVLSENSDNVV
ncbi:MAG: hypothetical protein KH434_02320 [Clostridium sp.]|nr:hypothetical protein [Clostridium sp.]